LVGILARQQETFGAPPTVKRNLEVLRQPSTVVVLAGQQAGLLGGPLFTWFKALTAIQTARRLGSAVPVFWIAADDHDWNEISHVEVLDTHHELVRIAYDPGPGSAGQPACRVPLNEGLVAVWQALEERLPPSEFREEMVAAAQACYAPGGTMVTGFGRWLTRWLGPLGLMVVDASDPALKRLAVDLFSRELAEHPASRKVFDERTAALKKTGFQPQVHLPEGVLNVMWMEGPRRPMRLRGEVIEMGGARPPWNFATLQRRVRDHPEWVSPNVLLNPLYQDTVLPAAIHVVGPAEIAYFAQVRPLYRLFDLPEPVLVPRVSATLLGQRALLALEAAGVTAAEVLRQPDQAMRRMRRRAVPERLELYLEEAKTTGQKWAQRLAEAVEAFDPGLTAMAERMGVAWEASLKKLEEKLAASAVRQNEALVRQMTYLKNLLRPSGHLQERVLGPLSFMVRYGPDFTARLADRLPEDPTYHYVVELS